MDQHMHDAYPDPDMPAFINPYPSGYEPSPVHTFGAPTEEDFYPPRPQPLIHEGYIPQSGYNSDVDEDPTNGYSALKAQFGLNFVLNPHSADAGRDDEDDDDGQRRRGYSDDEGLFDDFAEGGPQRRLDSLERELLDVGEQDAEVDPDFRASDEDDDRSDDDMSINSDLLDEVLAEETRGKGRGRGRGRGRGAARGRRGWKWALKGTEHDPSLAKRGRGRGRGRPRGSQVPRGEGRRRANREGPKVVEPTPEFKRLQALATQNFLNQDLQSAADYAREAVKTNPEIFAAHSLLSEILLAEGKEQDSLTVLLAGAHTKRDPALWLHVAERTLELAGERRTSEVIEQAIYCYAWAIKLDITDYDARREKLNLLLESGQTARARTDCRMMIKAKPFDLAVIRQYADLCADSNQPIEIARAKQAYDKAIDFYSKGKTLGLPDTQWSHLNVYMDLVEESGPTAEAVKQLKKLSRWLLGRKEEEWWDDIEGDDREYDLEDVPRRIQLPQFKASAYQNRPEMYGEGLPLELRAKLGMYRVKMGRVYLHEAMRHFQLILDLADDVQEYHDLFRDVAEALKSQLYYNEAISFYEPIRSVPEACDHEYFMHLAECYMTVDRKADAEECYKFIIDNDAEDIESRIALAKFYEAEQRMAEAIPLVHEVMRLGRTDAVRKARLDVQKPQKALAPRPTPDAKRARIAEPSSQALTPETTPEAESPRLDEDDENRPVTFGPKARRARRAKVEKPAKPKVNEVFLNMQQQAQRIKTNYLLLKTSKDGAEAGDEDSMMHWMTAAQDMLEDFRGMKVFYPGRDKHVKFTGYRKSAKSALQNEMEAMKKRLQDDDVEDEPEPLIPDSAIPDEFHDIKFQEWLDIFCNYALQLAKDDERDRSYDTLQAAFYASVFYHNAEAKKQIHATWLACALLLNDEQTLCNAARWFISEYSHSSSTYQLFAGVNRLFAGSSNWFNSGPTQKFILRSVKALDYALLDAASRARYSFTATERSSYTHGGRKSANPAGLPDLDPGVLVLYGHIMAAAQSWASALNYYFRCFVLRPTDPVVNLCIALAYIQMAMKRQSENRHWQIYQGLAFLERYYRIRTTGSCEDDDNDDEEEDDAAGDAGAAPDKPGAVEIQEAEYNKGRVFHLLGLNSLAIPAYEKCLALAANIRAEKSAAARRHHHHQALPTATADAGTGHGEGGEDDVSQNPNLLDQEEFTQEAAFALASIYALADNNAAARAVTEKWLVI